MLFHSLTYFVFFPTVVALFFVTPPRFRWALLLVASYVFYGAWKAEYLLLLGAATAIDYTLALRQGREQRPARRKALLVGSLVLNLGMLFAFKYAGFFSASAGAALRLLGVGWSIPTLHVLLPVGISFYTFQAMAYSIDVYRRARAPEPHFGRFAVYIAFFPQLVAGPIERPTTLLPQFHKTQRWDSDRAIEGLGWILWGLFKKVVVADRAAFFVNAVYAHPTHYQGLSILAATYAFALQIYCDFSGYSDIAVGSARVLGFELMQNFDRPYWSPTIVDFWRRWHISLSTWFRDYVYLPLGGNRVPPARRVVNLALVFLLSGLWHGANWTFVLWGAFHGALMIATLGAAWLWRRRSFLLEVGPATGALARAVGVLVTFHLVCLGWLLFRADDLAHARQLLAQLTVSSPVPMMHELTHIGPAPPAATTIELGILVLSAAVLESVEHIRRTPHVGRIPVAARWLAWSSLCVWTLVTAVQTHSPFIYFQF